LLYVDDIVLIAFNKALM
jgi:hypothetical protein